MILTPMRFCGYTWHHNPRTLKVESGRRVVELAPPMRDAYPVLIGEQVTAIEGAGELYGDDSIAQYAALYALYSRRETGVLAIPGIGAMQACFVSLTLSAEPSVGVIGYRFRFERAQSPSQSEPERYVVTSDEGETLWDLSYRLGIPIEELVALNDQVRYVDAVMRGERVRVC